MSQQDTTMFSPGARPHRNIQKKRNPKPYQNNHYNVITNTPLFNPGARAHRIYAVPGAHDCTASMKLEPGA